jgi:hypothetical protein
VARLNWSKAKQERQTNYWREVDRSAREARFYSDRTVRANARIQDAKAEQAAELEAMKARRFQREAQAFADEHVLACFKCGTQKTAFWHKYGTSKVGPWIVCKGCVRPKV